MKRQTKSIQNNSENILNTAKDNKTNSKRIYCNKCPKKFNKTHTFNHHMKTIHEENEESSHMSNSNSNNYNYSEMTFQENKRSLRSKKSKASAMFPNN